MGCTFLLWCNHSSYPDVQLWALVLLPLKDLWSSIRRAAAPRGQRLPRLEEVPKSKIYTGQNTRVSMGGKVKIISNIKVG